MSTCTTAALRNSLTCNYFRGKKNSLDWPFFMGSHPLGQHISPDNYKTTNQQFLEKHVQTSPY